MNLYLTKKNISKENIEIHKITGNSIQDISDLSVKCTEILSNTGKYVSNLDILSALSDTVKEANELGLTLTETAATLVTLISNK